MKVTVKSTSPSERVLTVVIDSKKVDQAYEQAFREKLKHLRVKGFRKGSVPAGVAKKHLTDSHLLRRVVNILVPSAYKEALKLKKLQPLGKPDWELKESARGKDLSFEAIVHVMPLLKIKGYKGFPIERPRVSLDEGRIDQILYQRQQGTARYIDRVQGHKAVLGDFAFIDYQAFRNKKPLSEATVSNFLLEMREEKFLPGFVKQLVGTKAAETKRFALTLPKDYADSKLAGKEVEFEVKVHQLKERVVPKLDDNFAKNYSKANSLKELKDIIRQNLETQSVRRIDEELTNLIIKALVKEIDPATIPLQLQEGHSRLALRTQTKALERQGSSLEKHLQARGISSEHYGEELKLTGIVEARLEILYRSIAAAEDIVVLTKEVDQAIIAQAKSGGSSAKELKAKMLKEDTYKILAYRILIGKVRRFILDNAEVTHIGDGKTAEDKLAEQQKPKAAPKKAAAKKKKAKSKKKAAGKKKKKAAAKKKVSAKKKKATKTKAKAKAKTASKKKKASKSKVKKRKAAAKKKVAAKKATKKKAARKAKAKTKAAKKKSAAKKSISKKKAKAKAKKRKSVAKKKKSKTAKRKSKKRS